MGNIANGVVNTFIDGDVVSANGTAPALLRSALNPKMEVITAAINDNDSRVAILEGQVASIGSSSVQYNVKAAPFNAVGDGIADDTAAIQAAITTAGVNKGTVIFPAGTYKITDAITVSGSCNIVGEGTGQGSVIKKTVVDKSIFLVNSSNVLIADLSLDVAASNNVSTFIIQSSTGTPTAYYFDIVIQNCNIYTLNGSAYPAIYLQYVDRGMIYNNTIANTYSGTGADRIGIDIRGCRNYEIIQNVVDSRGACVFISRAGGGSEIDYPPSQSVTVRNNTFANVVQLGISITSAYDCIIDSNYFYTYTTGTNVTYINTGSFGAIGTLRLIVRDNRFDGSYTYAIGKVVGIYTNYSSFMSVSRNWFIECGNGNSNQGALRIDTNATNLTISDNNFYQCQYAGIQFILDTTSVTYHTSILNNVFIDIYTQSAWLNFPSAIVHTSKSLLTVSGNALIRGTKTASYVNTNGLSVETINTNGAFIEYSGNNFSNASNITSVTSSAICIFYEEPTGDRVFKGVSSAPTTGTWQRGDKVLIADPSASGYIGYVCVTAGTPGTWKGYGAIQA